MISNTEEKKNKKYTYNFLNFNLFLFFQKFYDYNGKSLRIKICFRNEKKLSIKNFKK